MRDDREFWLLIDGKLRQVQVALDRDKGLRLTEIWAQETGLGTPVHAAQTDLQGQRIYLVTHAEAGDSYFATAIDIQTHKILWQRRLGVSWRDDPIVLDGRVLTLDRAAAVYEFDPEKLSTALEGLQPAGRLVTPAPAPPETRALTSWNRRTEKRCSRLLRPESQERLKSRGTKQERIRKC